MKSIIKLTISCDKKKIKNVVLVLIEELPESEMTSPEPAIFLNILLSNINNDLTLDKMINPTETKLICLAYIGAASGLPNK